MNDVLRFGAPLLLSLLLTPLAQGATLSVTVVDDTTGAPVVGAEVFAGADGRGAVVITDAAGVATVEASGSGPFMITAAKVTVSQILGRRIFNSNATTVQGVTDTSFTMELGYSQVFEEAASSGGSTSTTYTGSVTSLDITQSSAWVVRSPGSSTSGLVNGVNTASYSVNSAPTAAPFLFSAQVPLNADGTYSTSATPLTYDVRYDVPNGATLHVGKDFSESQVLSVTGVTPVEGDPLPPSVCGQYSLNFPGGRGQLGFDGSCVEGGPATFAWSTPDFDDLPAGTDIIIQADAIYSQGGQLAVTSGHAGLANTTVALKPLPSPVGYEPLYLADLPGTSFEITGSADLRKEIVIFSEGHNGPGNFIYSVTTWTNVNYNPSANLAFPKVPRASTALPAIGSRFPDVGSQTAIAITAYETNPTNYALSFNYLETFAPAPEPTPTQAPEVEEAATLRVRTVSLPGLEGPAEAAMMELLNR